MKPIVDAKDKVGYKIYEHVGMIKKRNMKTIIMFVIGITVCGCCNDKEKFSEISTKHAIDSIKYIAVIEKGNRTIKNDNDIYTIKTALSKSYCIKPKSIMKHPPYTGTMTIYCDNETFVYEIYGNTFVSGDNIHYMAPINLSWSIKSFGE